MTNALVAARRRVAARPWLAAAVVLVLVAGGIFGYERLTASSGGSSSTPTVSTTLESVSRGSVQEAVSVTGTISPADEHDVSFSSSATVTSVRVKAGEKVRKGQVLGTIATLSLRSALAQARAEVADARATLATARETSSTTTAQLTADQTSVQTAKSSVRTARANLADAVLRSPIAGTVASVGVSKGDTAGGSAGSSSSASSSTGGASSTSAGQSTTSSTTSTSSSSADFVVIGMKKWTAAASVDDTEVGSIRKGDQAQLTTDNVTGRVFGTVSSVAVLSDSSSGSASYPVKIAITGSPSGLHDGASATISIIYKQVSNVVTVPTLAIHRDSAAPYVYVSKNGAKTKVTVQVGISSAGTTQIKSGLKAGQQVYVQTITRQSGSTPTTGRSGSTSGYSGGGTGGYPGSGSGGFGGGFPGAGSGGFGGGQGGTP